MNFSTDVLPPTTVDHGGTVQRTSTVDLDAAAADAAQDDFSSSALYRFGDFYQSIHGYLSLVVCAFGIVSNALNVLVLTRRSMSNATNCLLTALAVTDLLTMTAYVPYAGYFYCYAVPAPTYGALGAPGSST